MKKGLLCASCFVALSVASAAAAQTESATAQAEHTDTTSVPEARAEGIKDIIVTAQRRSENLQRAAIAVSAISGDQLSAAGITRPTELTSVVPALQVVPSAGPYSLFYLRGVGNFSANALSDPAVAFNFDGVYIGRPSSTTGFFFDVERIEVLKGPQGTLYGRNATGGAVNVITRKPELGVLGVEANAEYGNYNGIRADVAVNVPLGDSAALRLSGIVVEHDGYMKDGTDDQKDLGARLSLRVEPADNLKIITTADYFRQRGKGIGAVLSTQDKGQRQGLFSPDGNAALGAQPQLSLGRPFAPLTFDPFLRNHFWGISSTIEWQVPVGTITIIPAYREGYLDYASGTPAFLLRQIEKDKQTSVEARLASDNDRPFRYLLGLFYYDENISVPYYHINQQNIIGTAREYAPSSKSMAAFARLTYAITPEFRLNAGARYTTEDKKFHGLLASTFRQCILPSTFFPTYVPGCPTAQPFPYDQTDAVPDFDPNPDGTVTIPDVINQTGANAVKASFEKVTYRVGGDWDITDKNLVYASFETGFKSGGFYFATSRGVYRPETIDAWTIGSKNRFFDNRLQLNVEGFYWKYKDQQISHLTLDTTGAVVFATENVGLSTVKGVEVEAQFLLTETTLLSADVQYLDAKYDDFIYTTPNLNGGAGNGTACPNVGTPAIVYVVDCSGNRPPNAPKWTFNLGARQTIPLANSGKIVLDARGHYQSRTLVGLEFTPPEYQKSFWLVDAQITYYAPQSRFSVGAFVNNLTNTTAYSSSYPVPSSFVNANALRPPRTYGVRAGVKF